MMSAKFDHPPQIEVPGSSVNGAVRERIAERAPPSSVVGDMLSKMFGTDGVLGLCDIRGTAVRDRQSADADFLFKSASDVKKR
jgi:hypothetical protein